MSLISSILTIGVLLGSGTTPENQPATQSAPPPSAIEKLTYHVAGRERYCEGSGLQRYRTDAVVSHVVTSLLQELLIRHKITPTANERYWMICEKNLSVNEEQRKMTAPLAPYFTLVARGITAMAEERITAEEAFDRVIKGNTPAIPENQWLKAAKIYSPEWAKQFLAYDDKAKLDSLLYQSYITLAKYIVLRDRLRQEVEAASESCDDAKLEAELRRQLAAIPLELPSERRELTPKIITECCNIIHLQTPEGLTPLVEAIKSDLSQK